MSYKPTVVDGSFNINRDSGQGGFANSLTAITELKIVTVSNSSIYAKSRHSKGGTATRVSGRIEFYSGATWLGTYDSTTRDVDFDFEASQGFPPTSNYNLIVYVTTYVSDGSFNTNKQISTVYEVIFPSTNSVILCNTAPSGGNKRVYLLSNSLENGSIQFFKNTTVNDEVYIAPIGGTNIDNRNFLIQLRRSAGIVLGRASNNTYILSYYHGMLSDAVYPFTIYYAWYGVSKGSRGSDVTTIVRNSYESGASGIYVSNGNMGGDPAPGVGKVLYVDYLDWNGSSRTTLSAVEGATFNFSGFSNASGTLNAIATNPTVLMDITRSTGSIIPLSERTKNIRLPDPSTNSLLAIVGYSTATTNTSHRINVYANGNLGDPLGTGFTLKPNPENACGVLLVSNGSKWYIMGTFAGLSTVFDAYQEYRTEQTSTICLITTGNGCRIRDSNQLDSDNTSALYFCKKSYGTNDYLVVNAPYNQVGSSTNKRFYRNPTTDLSAYLYIVSRLSSTNIQTLPVTMYPSEY